VMCTGDDAAAPRYPWETSKVAWKAFRYNYWMQPVMMAAEWPVFANEIPALLAQELTVLL
jgi:hypothetical protein